MAFYSAEWKVGRSGDLTGVRMVLMTVVLKVYLLAGRMADPKVVSKGGMRVAAWDG